MADFPCIHQWAMRPKAGSKSVLDEVACSLCGKVMPEATRDEIESSGNAANISRLELIERAALIAESQDCTCDPVLRSSEALPQVTQEIGHLASCPHGIASQIRRELGPLYDRSGGVR